MNDDTPYPGLDAQVRRKANRLGLLLGGACLALTALFFIIFSVNGFPKDPNEYRKMMNRRQALLERDGAEGKPLPGQPLEQRPVDQRPADLRPADQH